MDGDKFNGSPHSSLNIPSSPVTSEAESMINITPCTSPTPDDDLVVYTDSERASEDSFPPPSTLTPSKLSPTSSDGYSSGSTKKTRSKMRTSRRNSGDSTPSPHPKRRIRRKSTKSDSSEKSHKSTIKTANLLGSEYPIGAGYTVTPATGKIFRNLLILEQSLREQVAQQKALRRKYVTFLAILCSLIASISHHLFIVDSSKSVDGAFRVVLQFVLLALLVTISLYHLSGEYQRTIVVPRKFLSSTNKGLRQINVRLVKIKTSYVDEFVEILREFILFLSTICLRFLHSIYPSMIGNKYSKMEVFLVSCQSQCQPRIGLTDVKLALNARVFSTDVREGWELYRSEFWLEEGVRRRQRMMSFVNGEEVKRDKKERKVKKKTGSPAAKLSQRNLEQFTNNLELNK